MSIICSHSFETYSGRRPWPISNITPTQVSLCHDYTFTRPGAFLPPPIQYLITKEYITLAAKRHNHTINLAKKRGANHRPIPSKLPDWARFSIKLIRYSTLVLYYLTYPAGISNITKIPRACYLSKSDIYSIFSTGRLSSGVSPTFVLYRTAQMNYGGPGILHRY